MVRHNNNRNRNSNYIVRHVTFSKLFPIIISITLLLMIYTLHLMTDLNAHDKTITNRSIDSNVRKEHERRVEPTCDGEKMQYSWKIKDPTGVIHTEIGKKFDCNLTNYLHSYKLSDNKSIPYDYVARMPGKPDGAVFVTAANYKFYGPLRRVIANIKRTFGISQKIIIFDLGGITKNSTMMDELSAVCNLDIRIFDYKPLLPKMESLKTFAWKIMILAQIYSEYDTFIYVDTSVHFINADYKKHFNFINNQLASPFLFGLGTYHGIKHATLHETLDYLPLYTGNQNDIEMQEANMMIIQKSEFSRKLLKWALLCALTLECIEPRKVPWDCPEDIFYTNNKFELCHRMDQSVMSILVHNMEAELIGQGKDKLISHFSYNHPSHRLVNHILARQHLTTEDIGKIYKC